MPTLKIETEQALVIGGGIVGFSIAIALRRKGVPTTLVAPGSMRGTASWGNAGHIATEQVEPLASLATLRSMPRRLFARGGALSLPPADIGSWLPFSLRLMRAATPASFARGTAALQEALAQSMPAWRALADALGTPGLLVESGHFIVWESEASAAAGRTHWAGTATGTAHWRDAEPDELARIQALVAQPLAGAIRFDGSGQILDPELLGDALRDSFLRLGGTLRDNRVTELRRDGNEAVAARLDDGSEAGARAVIVAAGAASAALLRPLGIKAPLIAERGYHIQAPAPDWPEDMPPVVFEDRSMIVTRFRSGLRAASFVEFSTLASPPDPRKWARLHAHADALGLPIGADAEPWIGARPTLPDYLPAIGRSTAASNLYYAFGHQHLGLTLGPITGEAMAALVTGAPSPIGLAPFDLARFG